MFDFFKKRCPKCDSKNIKKVKASLIKKATPASLAAAGCILLGPVGLLAGLLGRPKKPLNVCRDCGFSWEDR